MIYISRKALRDSSKISTSFLRYSVRKDLEAPVVMERGLIACNTPALQEWWDAKPHHHP